MSTMPANSAPSRGRAAEGIASTITRRWVALYTRGLHPEAAHRRRSEIESDLWEQCEDARAMGRKPLPLACDVMGRAIRGIPGDIAWRSRMEGSLLSMHIPANRGVGILFLLTVVLAFISSSIAGYDTAAEGWEDEMRRLTDMRTASTNANIVIQMLTGIALIGASGLLSQLLRPHNAVVATAAGYGLAAAGILTLAASAMYAVMVEFARQWAADPAANASAADTARAFAVGMSQFNYAGILAMVLSIGAMAVVTARAQLVPRWAAWLPGVGVPVFLIGIIVHGITDGDSIGWVATMVGLLTSVSWLMVAGVALIARGANEPIAVEAPASA